MADLKKRTLHLSSGKQINLFGNSLAIGKSLEIGEGGAPNILSVLQQQPESKNSVSVFNPHRLTADELNELADFNIQLWMNLKAELRRYGQVDPRIFAQETTKTPTSNGDKPASRGKKKSTEKVDKESVKANDL
jgi:hypothetical protein